jgi:hypothetical protein
MISSDDDIGLKEYLTKNFRDSKYKNVSLLDIYRKDSTYFNQLKKTKQLRQDALQFIAENETELIKAEFIPTEGIRDFVYEQIIQKYLDNKNQSLEKKAPESGASKSVVKEHEALKQQPDKKQDHITQKKDNKTVADKEEYPKLICPFDLKILTCFQVKRVYYKQKKVATFNMPLYKCKICGRCYTTLSQYDDMAKVRLNETQYINLTVIPSKKAQNKRPVATFSTLIKQSCYVYGNLKVKECQIPDCHHQLINIHVNATSKKGKHYIQECKMCPQCGMLYVPLDTYENNQKCLECMNSDELQKLRAAVEVKAEENRLKREEQKRKRQEAKIEKDRLTQLKKAEELKKKQESKRPIVTFSTSIKQPCYVYRNLKVKECQIPDCHHQLISIYVNATSKKGKHYTQACKMCPQCGMLYVSLDTYNSNQECLDCRNSDELQILMAAVEAKVEENRLKREEQKRKSQEAKIEKARLEQLKKTEELKKKQGEEARREKNLEQQKMEKAKREAEQVKIDVNRNSAQPKKLEILHTHDNAIHVKDFVVRRNVFKCRHNDHKLQNINAEISLINSIGEIVQSTVFAGYCSNCNIFFIMESTYENLKRRGTPICRV